MAIEKLLDNHRETLENRARIVEVVRASNAKNACKDHIRCYNSDGLGKCDYQTCTTYTPKN